MKRTAIGFLATGVAFGVACSAAATLSQKRCPTIRHWIGSEAPCYYDAKGGPLWHHEMWEDGSRTIYTLSWNGAGYYNRAGEYTGSRWVDVILWNDRGIARVNVQGLTEEGKIVPLGRRVAFSQGALDDEGRYWIVGFEPPPPEVAQLILEVEDQRGTVGNEPVDVCRIEEF